MPNQDKILQQTKYYVQAVSRHIKESSCFKENSNVQIKKAVGERVSNLCSDAFVSRMSNVNDGAKGTSEEGRNNCVACRGISKCGVRITNYAQFATMAITQAYPCQYRRQSWSQ
jgi:hypothetical protein